MVVEGIIVPLLICNAFFKNKPLFDNLFPFIQGEKGESGQPGKDGMSQHGAIKFGDTADTCTSGTAGTVRYRTSQNALQLCDGSAWLSVFTAGKGHVAYNPGRHCLDILSLGNSGYLDNERRIYKRSS